MGAPSTNSFVVLSLDLKGMITEHPRGRVMRKRRFQAKRKLRVIRQKGVDIDKISNNDNVRGPRSMVRCSPEVERRVRMLQTLIPNGESLELEGLFRETAEYILSLQMRVKMMQMMVDMLTGSSD